MSLTWLEDEKECKLPEPLHCGKPIESDPMIDENDKVVCRFCKKSFLSYEEYDMHECK